MILCPFCNGFVGFRHSCPGEDLAVVVDVESDAPRVLGVYDGEDEGATRYVDALGDVRDAPTDCVVVGRLRLPTRVESIDQLAARTAPVAGRDGWRVDDAGREWYSDAWIGLGVAS